MCPGLRGESVTEQEIKARSPGSADTAGLCNLCAAYRPIARTARLPAGGKFCLFFPLARTQVEENLGGPCGWEGTLGSGKLRGHRGGVWSVLVLPMGTEAPSRGLGGDYHRVWNGEETPRVSQSSLEFPALPSCCHLYHPHPARSCQVPPPAL